MLILILGRHLMWSRPDGRGGTAYYYYYDEITWIVGALALAWLTFYFVRRYRRALSLRRKPKRSDYKRLKRIVKIKRELSERYLRPGFSMSIHAIGIGKLRSGSGDDYCIQVFVNDANEEIWVGSGGAPLPDNYRGVPLILIEMPTSVFLSDTILSSVAASDAYPNGIREHQEVIIGGISGAHTNLAGQSGTIGYLCTRKSNWPGRKQPHLLSNSHVFADLRKEKVDDGDLIMQPSPGEAASNRPIGALVNFSPLRFDGDIKEPNHVDAAIAKLWEVTEHKPVIPMIGRVMGYVAKNDIEIGEAARKFGRTTGYTEGHIFSICLDIWVRYDRTGQSAFFQNQFLIEPALPEFTRFVAKGDSGSLLVDVDQYATGLIFAGMSEVAQSERAQPKIESGVGNEPAADQTRRVESYGVANPISEVLERLKIELLV